MKPTPKGWPRLSTSVFYDDAATAIDWLCEAFDFEVRLKVEGEQGRIEHSELEYGDALVMVGHTAALADHANRSAFTSPKSVGGGVTGFRPVNESLNFCLVHRGGCATPAEYRRSAPSYAPPSRVCKGANTECHEPPYPG